MAPFLCPPIRRHLILIPAGIPASIPPPVLLSAVFYPGLSC